VKNFKTLIAHLKKVGSLDRKFTSKVLNFPNKEIQKIAKEELGESILINLNELKSLVSPEKFDFQEQKIETIGFEPND